MADKMKEPIYQEQWLKDYGFTQAQYLLVRSLMLNPDVQSCSDNSTGLAENTAWGIADDEQVPQELQDAAAKWLDEETHPIWEMALYYYETMIEGTSDKGESKYIGRDDAERDDWDDETEEKE